MTSEEQKQEIEAAIRRDVPRSLFVDVLHNFPLAAKQAEAAVAKSREAVPEGITLALKRVHKAVGLVRHQITDEVFEQMILRNGGEFIASVPIEVEGHKLKQAPVFLTTARFGGTLVGFASHREVDDLPVKNASRAVLCRQNDGLVDNLFAKHEGFTVRERFVVIMVRRDNFDIGKIASLTVGVVDASQQNFIARFELNEFLAGYGALEAPKPVVSLKVVKESFKASKGGAADEVVKEG